MIRPKLAFLALSVMSACLLIAPERTTTLAGGAVQLQAPAGYCVDTMTRRLSEDFAVLAPCATLGVEAPVPDVVGLITVLAGAAGSGTIATDEIALRDFLITSEGRALLSQTGTAGDIRILSTQAFDDQVMVHFTDQGTPPLDGLQNEEWRAFRNIGGRLVTVGVRGLAVAPLQDGPGAGLLKLVLAGLSANETAPPS
ncbi:dihydroxy-acid dehydratase [Yoonia sp.]|uniref:dihydroxy-acid dehydratase n=1 Tax=Yoonia sp. TaxID=2212373 RepID=UPI002FD97C85